MHKKILKEETQNLVKKETQKHVHFNIRNLFKQKSEENLQLINNSGQKKVKSKLNKTIQINPP